ncbi:MAG: histidine phosphatase family protein [Bacteroidales bacterium]|nr:histidine phosphatase family protein [Bacteroidales bacterium]
MKRILILRHAKSDWSDDNVDDKDRVLNYRGENEAKITAKVMLQKNLSFDAIVSSPAARALQTATIVKKITNYPKEILVEECFYFSDMRRILAVIRRLDNQVDNVLIVGHNPLWSNLVLLLAGKRMLMDTGCLAELESDIDSWEHFDTHQFTLQNYINPKEVKK